MVFLVRDESKYVEFPMASLKDALNIIRSGHPEGWGIMLELTNNKERLGLGYNSQNLKKPTLIPKERQVLLLSKYFSSANPLVHGHICDLEENVEEDTRLIFMKTKGWGATKWTVMQVLEVTMIKM